MQGLVGWLGPLGVEKQGVVLGLGWGLVLAAGS